MGTSARQTACVGLAILASAAACGKKAADDRSPPWHVDAAEVQARLQGTWTVKDGDGTARWQIDGDHVVVEDARFPRFAGKLVIESPCSLAVRADSGMDRAYYEFALDGQTLHLGAGRAGVRQGDTTVVCAPLRVYVRTASGCAAYQHGADHGWVKRVATCAQYTSGIGETFDGHTDTSFGLDTVKSHGLVFADDQMWAAVAQRAASVPAAKP